jgi:NADH:ubiquinone oxidoreductase subunit 2 (subunit N)
MGYGIAGAQSAVLFYLAVYTFTTLGTFGVVAWVGRGATSASSSRTGPASATPARAWPSP